MGKASARRLVVAALASVLLHAPLLSFAQEACQGPRKLDPRSSRLQVVAIHVSPGGIAGRVKNTGDETAVGAGVWVNFYTSRRGGFAGQQCVPIGDLAPGEERDFLAVPQVDTARVEAWDYAADVAVWR